MAAYLEVSFIEDVFKTFREFYDQKDYANAELFLRKNADTMPAGLWNYSLGTVLAQKNDLPLARYHFLRAKNLGIRNKNLEENLHYVEEKLEIPKWETPLSLEDYSKKAALWSQGGLFTTLALLVLIAGIIHFMRTKVPRLIPLYGIMMLIPLGMNFWVGSWESYIVRSPQLVLEGPSAIFTPRGEIPAGVRVLTRQKGDWFKIIYPSRFEGWIRKQGLISLENDT
jgi:hypothetical protein